MCQHCDDGFCKTHMADVPPSSEYKEWSKYEKIPCPGCGIMVTKHYLKYGHICGIRNGGDGRKYMKEYRKMKERHIELLKGEINL